MGFLQKVINKVIKAIEVSELANKAITLNIGQKEFVKNYIRMLDVFSKDIMENEKENQLSFEYGVGRMAIFYLFLCRYIKERFKFPIRDKNINDILSFFEKKYIESVGMYLFTTYGRGGLIELFKVRLKSYASSHIDDELLASVHPGLQLFGINKKSAFYGSIFSSDEV